MTEFIYGISDDHDRVVHMISIIAHMHELFGISMEEVAGRFACYASQAMGFVQSPAFYHWTAEDQAWFIYFGKSEEELRGLKTEPPEPYPCHFAECTYCRNYVA